MSPAPFLDKPTLEGERALLRPFTPRDIAAMGPVLADAEVLKLTGSVHTTAETLAQSDELDARTQQWYETREAQPDRLDLAIVDRATGVCVGEAVLNEWSEPDASCNFRILIGAAGRGKGLGLEATRMLLDHAFRSTDLNRIELEVYDFNPRARHVYRRAGFVEEGRRRQAFTFDGIRIDAIVMSMLRDDWIDRQRTSGD
ncbi:GNAT family N-acetyltransferase [Microbacterium thalassium]|uniref:RimJ/RimL family protein N-acetyltransferase n=1 Tax=Microbacterium thalassium TaxID=362649 RepID=A0A7X0FQH8_9MICO|nr:GNAT family protein [Microbacterium thalassium]MBB6391843.1 RimJ/RimL family protein N-acetyltransferase [Microbacterium thalassium]GLK23863.1 acetyltransferase [Microbacterium thalassium]